MRTWTSFALDRSGSMGGEQARGTVEGFNAFINEQRQIEGEMNLSLTQFDDKIEDVYSSLPISEVPYLSLTEQPGHHHFAPRGSTRLFDSVAHTIVGHSSRLVTAKSIGVTVDKNIIVVITDGGENASTQYKSLAQISELISGKRALGWEFVFIGAGQDAWGTGLGQSFGLRSSIQTTQTFEGYKGAYSVLSNAVGATRTTGEALVLNEDQK